MVSIREVGERLTEPLILMRGICPDNTALHNLLKQLVAGFLEWSRNHDFPLTFCFLLRHVELNIG